MRCSRQLDLSLIDDDFVVQKDSGETNMRGWYEGNGAALPHGKTITAILDAVIIFTIDTGGR